MYLGHLFCYNITPAVFLVFFIKLLLSIQARTHCQILSIEAHIQSDAQCR